MGFFWGVRGLGGHHSLYLAVAQFYEYPKYVSGGGDCCLMPNEQFFSYLMGGTSYIQ